MDIYVVLTGRRGHGKDTVAGMMANYGANHSVALADWLKELLAKEFFLPVGDFYDEKIKDAPLAKPIVLNVKHLHHFVNALVEHGYKNYANMATSKWYGVQFDTLRDLMVWFGHDFVNELCGEQFHCSITDKRIEKIKSADSADKNVILITDGRVYGQSKYWVDRYPLVFTVKVEKPGGPMDNNALENSVDQFPAGYFYATIINDGSKEDLDQKVKTLMEKILADVDVRTGKGRSLDGGTGFNPRLPKEPLGTFTLKPGVFDGTTETKAPHVKKTRVPKVLKVPQTETVTKIEMAEKA